jgi:hypothetical protein
MGSGVFAASSQSYAAAIFRFPEPTIPGKSCERASRQLRCGVGLPRSGPSLDCTTGSVRRLRASDSTRASAGGEAAIRASLDGDRLAKGVCRSPAKAIFAAIFQNQLNRSAQAFTALFQAATLPIGAGNFRRPGNKPFAVALNDRSEFIPHGTSIDRKLQLRAGSRFDSLSRRTTEKVMKERPNSQ